MTEFLKKYNYSKKKQFLESSVLIKLLYLYETLVKLILVLTSYVSQGIFFSIKHSSIRPSSFPYLKKKSFRQKYEISKYF